MSDLAEWKKVAEALRTAEFMSSFVMITLAAAGGADRLARDVAIVYDRIKAVIAALDELQPGFLGLVEQAEREVERELEQRAMKSRLN